MGITNKKIKQYKNPKNLKSPKSPYIKIKRKLTPYSETKKSKTNHLLSNKKIKTVSKFIPFSPKSKPQNSLNYKKFSQKCNETNLAKKSDKNLVKNLAKKSDKRIKKLKILTKKWRRAAQKCLERLYNIKSKNSSENKILKFGEFLEKNGVKFSKINYDAEKEIFESSESD